jgi:hypothetical protein
MSPKIRNRQGMYALVMESQSSLEKEGFPRGNTLVLHPESAERIGLREGTVFDGEVTVEFDEGVYLERAYLFHDPKRKVKPNL